VESTKDDLIILEKYYETLISDHIDMVVCNTMPTVSQDDETYSGNISDDLDAELGLAPASQASVKKKHNSGESKKHNWFG